jgi:hypothetical protein
MFIWYNEFECFMYNGIFIVELLTTLFFKLRSGTTPRSRNNSRLRPAWMGELKERSLSQLSTCTCSKQAETLSFSSPIQAGLSLVLRKRDAYTPKQHTCLYFCRNNRHDYVARQTIVILPSFRSEMTRSAAVGPRSTVVLGKGLLRHSSRPKA